MSIRDELIVKQMEQITALQSSLKEKEKECEKWREAFNATHTELQDERKFSKEMLLRENEYVEQTKKQIEELKAENERLKGTLGRYEQILEEHNL